jgi:hypothetical protein
VPRKAAGIDRRTTLLFSNRWFVNAKERVMLAKADNVRIKETIEFILNQTNVSPIRRDAVGKYLNQHVANLSANEFAELSGEMSVSRHETGGTLKKASSAILSRASRMSGTHGDNERMKRRAVVLLWKTLARGHNGLADRSAPAVDAVMAISTPSLDASLFDAMLKVSLCSKADAVRDFFENIVVNQMPEFVRRYKVTVTGSDAGTDKFTNAASTDSTNVQDFYFYYDYSRQRFAFAPNPPAATVPSHRVAAVSVPVVPWYGVPGNGSTANPVASANANFSGIRGCELSGARIMLTAQFTGCSFCWTRYGGRLRAAHIAPTRPGHPGANLATSFVGGGSQLAERLADPGSAATAPGMANAPGEDLLVFGSDNGNGPRIAGREPFYQRGLVRQVTVIGRDLGGTWELYAQTVDLQGRVDGRRIY